MVKLEIKSPKADDDTIELVKSAIESKIVRVQLGMEITKRRITKFESKYGVSSAKFISEMTAEDLKGGDLEYVEWAGEYNIWQRLKKELEQLREIEYSQKRGGRTPVLPRSDQGI